MPQPPAETVVQTRTATWPVVLGAHALIGIEPHTRGNPTAFGAGAELLWKARLGGFAELLSSEGTPIVAPTVGSTKEQSFGDRISVPFGFALRPLAFWFADRTSYWARLATGIGVQVGATVEHVRTSDDSATTGGFHGALSTDVPIWGGPKQGGVALRLYARLLATPSISLDYDQSLKAFTVYHPPVSGQLFLGLIYYP